ncbi:MAG: FAD-binding protein, partial [Gammaproteobacteria bacterium]|nr:FAD-binding protein [Thiotrichales bacterium]MBT7229078.1 FAD-binding protein [Gammaproteobacteria bacterium]
MSSTLQTDVVIIGASASGLMCAIHAGRRGRKVILLDHAEKAGKKILIAGGGRCNFTNYEVSAENYLSHNPHFCKSALSRFTQWDFIAMMEEHQIPYHERDHGQLFCDESARDILDMLLSE